MGANIDFVWVGMEEGWRMLVDRGWSSSWELGSDLCEGSGFEFATLKWGFYSLFFINILFNKMPRTPITCWTWLHQKGVNYSGGPKW